MSKVTAAEGKEKEVPSCDGKCIKNAHSKHQEGDVKNQRDHDKDACGKLWEIYVREAKEYDEGLVKSWKGDMENVLVFSGLYSAVLTAFIIESYPNLQPDQKSTTNILLHQISEQISNQSVTTTSPLGTPFTPTPAALACNILWFISLALALSSAFLATLIQQWARKFLHYITVERSASAQADLIKFLYSGLKNFGMQTMVDVIPSLLHISLFTFFAGLVAFLSDINSVLTWIFLVVLATMMIAYFAFSILPILNLSSPYSTPLSPMLWRYRRHISTRQLWPYVSMTAAKSVASNTWMWWLRMASILRKGREFMTLIWKRIRRLPMQKPLSADPELQLDSTDEPPFDESFELVQAPDQEAESGLIPAPTKSSLFSAMRMESHKRNFHREAVCLEWTLKSIDGDKELLSFVDACSNALEGEDELRISNFHLVKPLLESTDPFTNIVERTFDLLQNSGSPWHEPEHRNKCWKACGRALAVLSRVLAEHNSDFQFPDQFKKSSGPGYRLLNSLIEHQQKELGKGLTDWSRPLSFDVLCKALEANQDESSEADSKVDVIFGLLLDISGIQDRSAVLRYVSKRVARNGWGAVSALSENVKRLIHFSTILSLVSGQEVLEDHKRAIQELVLVAEQVPDDKIYRFLSNVRSNLLKSRLDYLITLAAFAVVSTRKLPAANRILELSLKDLDSELLRDVQHLGHQWKLLVQCLYLGRSGELTASDIRDILQYFHRYSRAWYHDDVFSHKLDWTSFDTHLVQSLEHYHNLWLKDKTMEHLDINGMLWDIRYMTFLEGKFESHKEYCANLRADSSERRNILSTMKLARLWADKEPDSILQVKVNTPKREKHTVAGFSYIRFDVLLRVANVQGLLDEMRGESEQVDGIFVDLNAVCVPSPLPPPSADEPNPSSSPAENDS